MRSALLSAIGLVFLPATFLCGDDLSWEGSWRSKKPGGKGAVACTLKRKSGKWLAYFEGDRGGQEFSYKIPVALVKEGQTFRLTGNEKIGGDRYELVGTFSREEFKADFKSKSGNSGALALKQSP